METEDFFRDSRRELEEYVRDRLLLAKMQVADKSSRLVAMLFTVGLLAMFGLFILLFLSIMAGYYFADLTGSLYAGFGIVAAAYILLVIILLVTRRRYEQRITDMVIKVFFDKTADETDENNRN
ncbi:phage holin family protein [Sediminibacterium ginsengisoli]|uniref:Putative Holin-X, holin superfamily III n=1 Tax=Sediminibacterium ginsengisoli TaxID=413434 RepID=A0A1T4N302_9BACT|nr:phage holin family protein [Sediminibacterium ginsengisoli]SJZ73437.1 Putative Holin-X, holin superfamily III [Sediminibacterium ginsengisoli]